MNSTKTQKKLVVTAPVAQPSYHPHGVISWTFTNGPTAFYTPSGHQAGLYIADRNGNQIANYKLPDDITMRDLFAEVARWERQLNNNNNDSKTTTINA